MLEILCRATSNSRKMIDAHNKFVLEYSRMTQCQAMVSLTSDENKSEINNLLGFFVLFF